MLNVGGELLRVPLADIVHVESIKHRLVFHLTSGKTISLLGTLKDTEAQLADKGFFRSNSYLLVNLRHVTGVRGTDSIHPGGVELPISRARRKPFPGSPDQLLRRTADVTEVLPDIPRLVTGVAEWLGCLVYLLLPPSFGAAAWPSSRRWAWASWSVCNCSPGRYRCSSGR